jgi:hypothetical protein
MTPKIDVDELIREAIRAEDIDEFDNLAEPGLPEMVVDLFRGRLRAYVVMFFFMILVCSVLAVYCGVRLLGTSDVPTMLRWGAGCFLCTGAALNAKNWYWMQMEHLATTREIKRVELLLAHLAAELRARP